MTVLLLLTSPHTAIPAKAGTQERLARRSSFPAPRFRGGDGVKRGGAA
jgi:hypothetical protein